LKPASSLLAARNLRSSKRSVKTFKQAFCEATRCDEDEFVRHVFWRTIHRRAALLVPFLGGADSEYFASDRQLIKSAGNATRVTHVRNEVRDYFNEADAVRWPRRVLRLRISTTRLVDLSKSYLRGSDSRPPM
jgi:hypothetical protein